MRLLPEQIGQGIQVKFFKGCLPQILLGPFLNTLTQVNLRLLKIFESRTRKLVK